MRRVFATIAIFVIVVLSQPANAEDYTLGVEYTGAIAPPHHEPVVGARVARYRYTLAPYASTKWAEARLTLTGWGLQKWRPSSVVGHGIDAYRNSDYSIERLRHSVRLDVSIYPTADKKFGLYSEFYKPLDRHSWPGHGHLTAYYWLVGFKGNFECDF